MPIEDFTCAPEGIIYVYCCVDDICQAIVAAKDEKYYGFEGHVVASLDGIIYRSLRAATK